MSSQVRLFKLLHIAK